MQSKLKRFLIHGWVISLSMLATLMSIAFLIRLSHTVKSEVIAAWVQGVGSLIAVIVAIGLYVRQYEDKRTDDANRTHAFVQAIRTELGVFWTVYCRDVQPHLNEMFKHHFEIYAPLRIEQLMIYRASPGAIGDVDNGQLRDLTVKVHVILFAIVGGLELNTLMLRELLPLEPFYHHNGKEFMIVDEKRKELSNHRERLRAHDRELIKLMPELFRQADDWLANHPAR